MKNIKQTGLEPHNLLSSWKEDRLHKHTEGSTVILYCAYTVPNHRPLLANNAPNS